MAVQKQECEVEAPQYSIAYLLEPSGIWTTEPDGTGSKITLESLREDNSVLYLVLRHEGSRSWHDLHLHVTPKSTYFEYSLLSAAEYWEIWFPPIFDKAIHVLEGRGGKSILLFGWKWYQQPE